MTTGIRGGWYRTLNGGTDKGEGRTGFEKSRLGTETPTLDPVSRTGKSTVSINHLVSRPVTP